MSNNEIKKDCQQYNRHELLEARRQLRKAGEAAEAVLWNHLKSRQMKEVPSTIQCRTLYP